ncbi:MAG TPA: sodium-translocating pyrophosphatase, partial [Patescibacteria group bacterium]|nr:sodium-translocating pyrophosphatase [Patescibacteria group bacterium]
MSTEAFALALLAGLLAVLGAAAAGRSVLRQDEGNELVREIGLLIRHGAEAFLRREYLVLAGFVAVVAVIIAAVIDYNVLGNPAIAALREEQAQVVPGGPWTALAYMLGAAGSGVAGWVGMAIAVRGGPRTTHAAATGLGEALRVAFRTGAVMGLTVAGVGLLGLAVVWLAFRDPTIAAGFGFGASSVALFARVGGGIFTKAADIAADMVGKVEAGIPEDDPRNPATIADNVGDIVGDVAGMGADLFESYVGAMIATLTLAAIGVAALDSPGLGPDALLIALPLVVAGCGILGSLAGVALVRIGPEASMSRLLRAFRIGVYSSAGLMLAISAGAIWLFGLSAALFWVLVVGVLVGQTIGIATEYFTSYAYRPTRWIAAQAQTGSGSVVIAGVAMGLLSTAVPAVAVVAGILVANELAGLYGVSLAAVGMLATVGISLATDAFGSVADNAGGIAEQAGMEPEVRKRTDALDALGNTTAATGKGFAIGSAVLTALALMVVYIETAGVADLLLTDPRVIGGMVLGAMLPFVFAALAMQAVGRAAGLMIEEVRRQFREVKGIMEGTAKP